MRIETYKSFGLVKFDMSEMEVVAVLGKPENTRTNNEGEIEYHYDGFIIRFDASSKSMREGTLLPQKSGELKINGSTFDCKNDVLTILCKEDGNPYEFYGYIVFFNLGLTLTGYHDGDESQKAISAFREGDWDQFKSEMKVFKYE